MTVHFIADRGDSRRRLDQVLVRHVTQVSRMSRTQAQSWIAEGLVSIGGVVAARASERVPAGAAVSVMLPPSTSLRETPRAEELPLNILYEDDHILAVNKPAGVVVHPSFRNTTGTLLNGVLWHLRNRPDVRPGLVSRLDKDTSGVLVIALSAATHAQTVDPANVAVYGQIADAYLAQSRGEDAAIALAQGMFATSNGMLRTDLLKLYQSGVDTKGCAVISGPRGPALNPECEIVRRDLCTAATRAQRTDLAGQLHCLGN